MNVYKHKPLLFKFKVSRSTSTVANSNGTPVTVMFSKIYWETVKKEGFNPVTRKKVYTYRRKLAKKIVDFTDEKGKDWFKSYFKYLEKKFQ